MQRLQNQFLFIGAKVLRHFGYSFNEESDPRVEELQRTINSLDNRAIQFSIQTAPDGTWVAESTNLDGIITGGNDPRKLNEALKDAIFTYFQIPPHLCVDALLNTENELVKQSVRISA